VAGRLRARFSRLLDVFVPPGGLQSPEERRRARFAIAIALSLTPVMASLSITQFAFGNPEGGAGSAAIGLVLALAPALYRVWGRLTPIVHGVLGFGWLALSFIAISSRGAGTNAATVGLAELPLFAVLLAGLRAGAVWAAISCATEIALAAMARADLLVERISPRGQLVVDYSALLVITLTLFAVGVMYEVRRKQALGEVADQDQALREAGRRQVEAETEARLAHAEKLASIGRVTAAVAHEINNPLSYLGMNLLFIREELDSPGRNQDELARALADSIDGVHRITHLVARLRGYARGEAEPSDAGATDIGAALDRAMKLAEPLTRNRAAVRCDWPALPPAAGQEPALVQVFVNLIVNAAQAVPEDRAAENEIAIRARENGEWLVVEIIDNGCGIPSEILPRLGQPFFTTKPIGEGTGLGLAVSQSTLRAIGGKLEFESEPGRTVARVHLPISRSQEATSEVAQAAPGPGVVSGLRILIVDDDERVARSLQRILTGHDITIVGGGAAGLDVLRERTDFDLILCDLMMPGMTGMDFYEVVAASHPELVHRMTFVTGGAFTEKGRAFCEKHAARVLAKPVSVDELNRVLAEVAGARQAGVGPRANHA